MEKPIQVDKGIPVPVRQHTRKSFWPFDDMKIGDSFFVPILQNAERLVTRNRVAQACSQRKRRDPKLNYTIRWEGNGIRVWRIKP